MGERCHCKTQIVLSAKKYVINIEVKHGDQEKYYSLKKCYKKETFQEENLKKTATKWKVTGTMLQEDDNEEATEMRKKKMPEMIYQTS